MDEMGFRDRNGTKMKLTSDAYYYLLQRRYGVSKPLFIFVSLALTSSRNLGSLAMMLQSQLFCNPR